MGDIRNVKPAYSTKDWELREAYYIAEVSKLPIPEQPNTKDVLKFNHLLDSLMDESLMEQAYVERNFNHYNTLMKNAEKEIFSIIKQQELTAGSKATENDIKGLTVAHLKKNPLEPNKPDIYTIVLSAEKRHLFIERVVKILQEKKQAMVTVNTMLKIETNIQ